jgi:hypothetical protein
MSDKKLSENLGCTIKQIRTSIKKLSEFDWFTIDTRANLTAAGYGGKTRFIIINDEELNNFLNTKPKPKSTPTKPKPKKARRTKKETPTVIEGPQEEIKTETTPSDEIKRTLLKKNNTMKYKTNDEVNAYELLKEIGFNSKDAIDISSAHLSQYDIPMGEFLSMVGKQKQLQKTSTYYGPTIESEHIKKLKEIYKQ